jgi:hypothetical protein|tara:strand:+ start:1518 stop:1775 length:258 start_codon:yes stop_codon:yes gene_type:complete
LRQHVLTRQLALFGFAQIKTHVCFVVRFVIGHGRTHPKGVLREVRLVSGSSGRKEAKEKRQKKVPWYGKSQLQRERVNRVAAREE